MPGPESVRMQWAEDRIPGEVAEVRIQAEVSEEYGTQRDYAVPPGIEQIVREMLGELYHKLWAEGLTPVSWSLQFNEDFMRYVMAGKGQLELRAKVARNGRVPDLIREAAERWDGE